MGARNGGARSIERVKVVEVFAEQAVIRYPFLSYGSEVFFVCSTERQSDVGIMRQLRMFDFSFNSLMQSPPRAYTTLK